MPQLTFDKDTQGRILNELTVKMVWYKKYYFRINRGEKLRELSWKEIEDHKYEKEATLTSNDLCDIQWIFSMNPREFIKMSNIRNYVKTNLSKPQPYAFNFNTSTLRLKKDLIHKLKPQDINYLYNKFSEIDINQVDV
jgi:predicted phosphatase